MSRRKFLGYSAGIGGASAAVAAISAIPIARKPFYSSKHPEVPENDIKLPRNGAKVLILGGGLAGLELGVELTSRGFQVEILEKSGTPGGKVKSWRDKTFGPNHLAIKNDPGFRGFVREHGTHAIWGFYKNLREFMGRYKYELFDPPSDHTIYHWMDRNGASSTIPQPKLPAPYDQAEVFFNFANLNHFGKGEGRQLLASLAKLFTFDYQDPKQREYLDRISITDYCKKAGLPDSITKKIYSSLAGMAFFAPENKLSMLSLAHLAELTGGSAKDMMTVNLFMNPPGETFIQPMVDYIEKHGGVVRYNTEVIRLYREGEKIKSVHTEQLATSRVRRCKICGELIFGDAHFDHCPFCNAQGEMLKDLSDGEKAQRMYTADYFVLAMDVPGLKKFIWRNEDILSRYSYFEKVRELHATEATIVNFWFNGRGYWENSIMSSGRSSIMFFPTGFDILGFTLSGTVPLLNKNGTMETYFREYNDLDVSIIETQIANTDLIQSWSPEQIADKCYSELKMLIKDLPPYESFYVNRWHHYTQYYPGDEALRPEIQSPIENLLVIGDMVFVNHPSIFMERTNVAAKMATNILLDKIGESKGRITILKSGTPSRLVSAMRAVNSIYI